MKIQLKVSDLEKIIKYKSKPNKLNVNANSVKLIATDGFLEAHYGDVYSTYIVSTECTMKEEGLVVVDRFALANAIKPLKGFIALRIKDNSLVISQKKKFIKLPTLNHLILDLLEVEEVGVQVDTAEFLSRLKSASSCMHRSMPQAEGVWVAPDEVGSVVVGTDGHAIYHGRIPEKLDSPFFIPANQIHSVMKFIKDFEVVNIVVHDGTLKISHDNADVAMFPVKEEYIKYHNLLPKDGIFTHGRHEGITLDKAVLDEAIALAESFSSKDDALIIFSANSKGVHWSNSEENKHRIYLSQETPQNYELDTGMDVHLLKSMISNMETPILHQSKDPKQSLALVDSIDSYYLFMPII